MKDLVIREAQKNDKQDVQEITRFTWEGQDYIDKVFDEWLEDGHFFVAEIENKVIGTAKLTIFPDKVGWLEGLRVHPQYRGQGIGRKLQDFTREYGIALIRKGVINCLDFPRITKISALFKWRLRMDFISRKDFTYSSEIRLRKWRSLLLLKSIWRNLQNLKNIYLWDGVFSTKHKKLSNGC